MQVAVSDKQLHMDLSHSPSSTPGLTPLLTPSFAPNTPDHNHAHGTGKNATSASPFVPSSKPEAAVTEEEPALDLDYSQPVSTLLRLGTQRAHVKAEHSAGAAALVQGVLPLEEYVRWLAILWRVYDVLELGLSEHANNPILAPTYDPALLERAPALAQDITHLLSLLPASGEYTTTSPSLSTNATPLPPFPLPSFLEPVFSAPPAHLSSYINHLKSLASSSATAPKLLAHAYVRYLGDLSGGQFIGARVKRSYHLDGNDGTQFYQFDLQKGRAAVNVDENETRADAKRRLGEVKDWYRRGMDEGVGEDRQLKVIQVSTTSSNSKSAHAHGPSSASSNQAQTQVTPAKAGTSKVETFIWFALAAGVGYLLNVFLEPTVRSFFGSTQ